MTQVDTVTRYVRGRLDHWGDEYALHRDGVWLGFAKRNVLAALIANGGYLGRGSSWTLTTEADEIEEIISSLAKLNLAAALVMRACYCGQGRRYVERLETARLLTATAGLGVITERQYRALRDVGDAFVAERLMKAARAA